MTEELRTGALLADIDKRLALVEQAQRLGERAAEHRWELVERSLAVLTNEVRKYAETSSSAASELSGSAAGRLVEKHIDELTESSERHETFIQQAEGALKLARWALGSSLLALIVSVLSIVRELAK